MMRSRPAQAHTTSGNRQRESITITQPINAVKATAADMMCVHQSSLCVNIVAPPQNTTAPMPMNGSHCHPSLVMSNICGSSRHCDHKATSSSHRHLSASAEMLFFVPAVKAIASSRTRNTNIAMYVVAAIEGSG